MENNKKKTNSSNRDAILRLSYAALFAALAYIGFTYFKIDIRIPGGKSSFHFGNTFVSLAALLIGGFWGGIAGAVGLSIGDLFDPDYIMYAPKTFILKLCIGLITGLVAHTIFHLSKPQDKKKILYKTAIAASAGLVFNIFADPLGGYLYNNFIIGQTQELAKAVAKIGAVTTSVNAVVSIIMSVLLYTVLRPILEKTGLFFRLEKTDETENIAAKTEHNSETAENKDIQQSLTNHQNVV